MFRACRGAARDGASPVEIIELRRGRTRAFIAPEAGGRLLQLEIDDGGSWLPLLRAPRDAARALSEPLRWGSYPMLPWPNRIDGGRFTWRDRTYALPADAPPHALHGVGHTREWRVERVTPTRCRLSLAFGDAWPFGGRAVQEFALLDDGIAQRIEVHATGHAFPAGAGWHPWFRRDVRAGAGVRALIPADRVYETRDMIPTGRLLALLDDTDLRDYPTLGARRLDHCYRLTRRELRIGWGDIELRMLSSPNVAHAVAYTPREGVCIEPQTCAIDAFNLDAHGIADNGSVVVSPGRPLIATTRWRWRIGV
jgi:aldose 1-epimerase